MSQSELKPCPFCGHSAMVVCNKYRHAQFSFSVQCGNLKTEGLDTCPVIPSTYEYTIKKDAIDAWNKRQGEEK